MFFIYGVFVLFSLLLCSFLFTKPKLLTLTSIFFSIVQLNWFVRYMDAPVVLNKLVFIFIGILFVRLFSDYFLKGIPKLGIIIRNYIQQYFFLTLLTIATCLYNTESVFLGLYELRYFFISIILLLGIYKYFWNELSIELFNIVIIWVALFQIPFSVIQYVVAEGGDARTLDSVAGSFSGYPELVSSQVVALGLLLINKMLLKKDLLNINSYILSILIVFPLLISKSRSATIYIVLIALFVLIYVMFQKKDIKSFIIRPFQMGFLSVIFGSLFYIMFWKDTYDLSVQFNPDYVFEYYMREAKDYSAYVQGVDTVMGRGLAISKSFTMITNSFSTTFFGYGGGVASGADAINMYGPLFQEYGELSGLGRNQYSKMMIELGMLGVFIVIFFLLRIKNQLSRIRNNKIQIKATYMTVLVSLLFMSFYSLTIGTFYYGFILSLLIATLQKEQKSCFFNKKNINKSR